MSRVVTVFSVLVVLLAALLAGGWSYAAYQQKFNIWWQSPQEIRGRLLREIPTTSTEDQVLRWLKNKGITASIRRHHVEAGDHPVSTTRGEAWTEAVLDRHGIIFATSVEVYFIFDEQRRLVDIGVRKTTDAP